MLDEHHRAAVGDPGEALVRGLLGVPSIDVRDLTGHVCALQMLVTQLPRHAETV